MMLRKTSLRLYLEIDELFYKLALIPARGIAMLASSIVSILENFCFNERYNFSALLKHNESVA